MSARIHTPGHLIGENGTELKFRAYPLRIDQKCHRSDVPDDPGESEVVFLTIGIGLVQIVASAALAFDVGGQFGQRHLRVRCHAETRDVNQGHSTVKHQLSSP